MTKPTDLGTEIFDSFGVYVERAEREESKSEAGFGLGRASRANGGGWAGTETFEDAVRLARYGWDDGAKRLDKLTARLAGRLANVSAVKRLAFDVMGPGTLDVGRYIIGHPESMMVWRESEELTDLNPARVLRVIASISTMADQSAEVIFWRGAAACAICDLAEAAGVRVELEMVSRDHSNGIGTPNQHTNRVMLKRPQDPLAPEIVAFALCHPASQRRIDFGVCETLPLSVRRAMGYSASYGRAAELSESEIGDAIYVPCDPRPFYSPETTAEWVVAELAKHEIEVEKT